MTQKYHIIPRAEHYSCMVDLLGRAGQLGEAVYWRGVTLVKQVGQILYRFRI